MSKSPDDIKSIIEAFPTIGAFAKAIGCNYEAARQMRRHGRINVKYWPKLTKACQEIDVDGVTYDWLVMQHQTEVS